MKTKLSLGLVFQYVLAIFFMLLFCLPLLFMISSSLKDPQTIFADVKSWKAFFPVGDVNFDQYLGVFERLPMGQFVFNSLFVSGVVVILGLFVNSLAGFAIARLKFKGQNTLLVFLIATLVVPFETIAMPLLVLVNSLPRLDWENGTLEITIGWLNTYLVQIMPFHCRWVLDLSFRAVLQDHSKRA